MTAPNNYQENHLSSVYPSRTVLPDWMQNIEDNLTEMQKMVRRFIMDRPACSVMVDMGGGKTLTTLSALSYLAPSGHILIVAPRTIIANTWPSEIEDWNIPLNTVSLQLNDKNKKLTRTQRLKRYDDLAAGKYPPSVVLCGEVLLKDLITYFDEKGYDWIFPTVVLDEAQLFKSHRSEKFKALKTVRQHITRLIELTGTPMPKDIQDLWSQIYLLDGGQALGPNITAFRNAYCLPKKVKADVTVFEPRPGALQEIIPRIAHLAIASYNTELPLPDRIYNDVTVQLPKEVREEYKTLSEEMIIEAFSLIDDDSATNKELPTGAVLQQLLDFDDAEATISAKQAAPLRGKLLQLASGTVYLDELSYETRTALEQQTTIHDLDAAPNTQLGFRTLFYADGRIAVNMHNVKTAALLDIINKADSPVLVPYMYRSDKKKIYHCLRQAGIDVRVFDKSPDMVSQWNKRKIPVLMLHPASAGHGLNLQYGGHHIVWYTLPDSLEQYQQTNARLYRPGQTRDVVIHRIIAKGTHDTQQPKRAITKGIEQDRLLDALHHNPDHGLANLDPNYRAAKLDAANRKTFARYQDGIEDRRDTRLVDPNYIAQMQQVYNDEHSN